MASTDRRINRDLIAEIRAQAPRFGFFQAVRLLALSARGSEGAAGIRFESPLSLGFPPSEILGARTTEAAMASEVEQARERPALHLCVGFMGLTGPSGTLPVAYTETLIERRNFHRDTAAHSFLDMFTHRSVSLFYQAWRKYRFHIAYEAGDSDGFTRNSLDLVGFGLKSQESATSTDEAIPTMLLSRYAGLLSQKPVSASSLAALLRGYFGIDTTIEQFVGQWLFVPTEEQSRLGGENCVLGETAMAGERIWDRQNKITIRLGPLNADCFSDFLPGKPAAVSLKRLVEYCVGQTIACDVCLVLEKECIPSAVLCPAAEQLRLGYNAWLHNDGPLEHQDDARFSILN